MVYCVRGQNFLKYVNLLKEPSGFVAARFARLQTVREGICSRTVANRARGSRHINVGCLVKGNE